MKNIFRQRTFCIFLLVFTALFLIMTSISMFQYYKEGEQEKDRYVRGTEADTQHVVNYIRQSFTSVINTCNSIFTSRWYTHYRNIAQIYQSEFHMLRRMEILADIQSKVTVLPFVYDILIITPHPESVIHRDGWSTIADYLNIYEYMKITASDHPGSSFRIQNENNEYCIILLEDFTPRREEGIICVLIDKKLFAASLKNIIPSNASYIQVKLGNQSLYESGEQTASLILSGRFINSPDLSIKIGYIGYEDTSMAKARILSYALTEIIIFVMCLIAAGLTTSLSLKPLNQLVKRFGGNVKPLGDPYRSLFDCIESFSRRNAQLRDEKESLSKSMNHFLSLMNKEALFHMMTDPDFDFRDENIVPSLPCIDKGCPFVLILLDPELQSGGQKPDPDLFRPVAGYGRHCYTFDIFPNNLCLMIWFADQETANLSYTELCAAIENLSKGRFYSSVSNILQNPEDIRDAYLSLKTELSKQKHERIDMPISLEIELINDLQANHAAGIIDILGKAKAQYDPNAFLWLFLRIASEYDMDSSDIVNQYFKHAKNHSIEEQWDIVVRFAESLCQSIHRYKNTNMDKSIEVMRRYINENYCDPNLSVNQLADYLSVHRTLISKMLKSRLGMTFSDYILELRIKKAMSLLKETDISIQEIGKKVGYINYTTFKRAFIRYLGISPREYREQ